MVVQSTRLVVDCPVCGRSVVMHPRHVSHAMTCSHCRGQFITYEADDGSLKASKLIGTDSLKRAEQLLRGARDTNVVTSDRGCRRSFRLISALDDEVPPAESDVSPRQGEQVAWESRPSVLLVELRDKVFARIVTDTAESKLRVVRAR